MRLMLLGPFCALVIMGCVSPPPPNLMVPEKTKSNFYERKSAVAVSYWAEHEDSVYSDISGDLDEHVSKLTQRGEKTLLPSIAKEIRALGRQAKVLKGQVKTECDLVRSPTRRPYYPCLKGMHKTVGQRMAFLVKREAKVTNYVERAGKAKITLDGLYASCVYRLYLVDLKDGSLDWAGGSRAHAQVSDELNWDTPKFPHVTLAFYKATRECSDRLLFHYQNSEK